jgi:5,10-methylenetetrahydromethanopterin reductase
MEVWLHAFARPRETAAMARRAEAWGFTGMLVADSQNLTAEVWVELAFAAAATERLRLGPGVTNPVTRDVAVTAAAAATLDEETGGRAVIGIARGDSALLQIGRRPPSVEEFERGLERLVGYLRGDEVEVAAGTASGLRWLDATRRPVPVQVAASGPHTIAVGARHAAAVDFTVGAEAKRLRWAIATAREVGRAQPLSLGAFVNVAVDPDRARARDLVRGSVSTLARFASEGGSTEGLSAVTREGIGRLAADFEEARHGQSAAPAARELGDEFIDRFAVCGPAAEVAERLASLADLGLERIVVVPCSVDAEPAAVAESNERFAADVLPLLAGR